jgi:hypothetical protein
MTQTQIPPKPEVSEKALVAEIAEELAPHGYKVSSHTLKIDHEKEEHTLTIKAVRSVSGQKVLNLNGTGPDDE